jgi:ketosteroid isomerase-like protein
VGKNSPGGEVVCEAARVGIKSKGKSKKAKVEKQELAAAINFALFTLRFYSFGQSRRIFYPQIFAFYLLPFAFWFLRVALRLAWHRLLLMKSAAILLTFISAFFAQTRSGLPAEAIHHVLDEQAAAWNRGDLEEFLRGYRHSPNLSFYSGGTVTSGWEATLQRYRTRYQGAGHEMGKLTFSDLEIHPLSAGSAWVGGRWHLEMKNGEQTGGLFTLILRKFSEGWRIVHDHTSEESKK